MARPLSVYDPMTGRLRRRAGGRLGVLELPDEYSDARAERVGRQLGLGRRQWRAIMEGRQPLRGRRIA